MSQENGIGGLDLQTTILWLVVVCALLVFLFVLGFLIPAFWRLIRSQRRTPEELARRERVQRTRAALIRAADGIMDQLEGETQYYRVATLAETLTRVGNAIRYIDAHM